MSDRRLVQRLLDWYAVSARELPWRTGPAGDRDPYIVLVSEVMLQQTQVSRVAERFAGFLRRFPTIEALAAADDAEVAAAWAGLGYYRRARLLHQAARAVSERHGGEIPRDAASLRALPGVGRYTAGAVASIAFGQAEPIVDGNVARVLMRLGLREGTTSDRASQDWAWARAGRIVDEAAGAGPGRVNEALMELGATVCTPRAPACGACPLGGLCRARRAGRQAEIPAPKPRPARAMLHVGVALAVDARGRRLVERRDDRGLWAGIWQAPSVERLGTPWVAGEVAESLGIDVAGPLLRFDHQTTHRDVCFSVWAAARARAGGGRVWKSRRQIEGMALGTPQRRILLELDL